MKKMLLVIGLVLVSSLSYAASFDCSKARSFVEKAICNDPVLSALDDDLDAAYNLAFQKYTKPSVLEKEQSHWLKTKRNACRTNECLISVYHQRIAELQSI